MVEQAQMRAFHRFDPRGARQRLIASLVIGAIAYLVAPEALGVAARTLIVWNLAGVTLLVLAWLLIARADVEETRRRAAAIDPGRTLVWLVVIASSIASVFAAMIVLHRAKVLPAGDRELLVSLCVATVLISWALTHTAFTLRYAHLYYRIGPCDDEGGIELPGGAKPDDLDFAYFAFTIGMCFQVSDVTITSREIRHAATAHAMLSFLYNTVILALAFNVLVGQMT